MKLHPEFIKKAKDVYTHSINRYFYYTGLLCKCEDSGVYHITDMKNQIKIRKVCTKKHIDKMSK